MNESDQNVEAVCLEREHLWIVKRDGKGFICHWCHEFRSILEWQGICSECHCLVKKGDMHDSPFPMGGKICVPCYRNELSLLGAEPEE